MLGLVIFLAGRPTILDRFRSRYFNVKQTVLDSFLTVLYLLSMAILIHNHFSELTTTYPLLTAAQEKVFRDYLHNRPPGAVSVFWLSDDHHDRKNLAEQLARLLREELWTVSAESLSDTTIPTGIVLHMQNERTPPPHTDTLRSALALVELPSKVASKPKDFSKPGQLRLVIGPKP
jgi:hypothetical protein